MSRQEARIALHAHWREYLMEACELAVFMVSACGFGTLLFHPDSPVVQVFPSIFLRRVLMGIAMAATSILIIRSPFGRQSGAHFNPAITLTFFWLGKVRGWDAVFYVIAQFAGGLAGVLVAAQLLGHTLAHPAVRYVVTVPGTRGMATAFIAELAMATILMSVVLKTSNNRRLAPYTSYFVGVLVVLYIVFFSSISGFSINPARTASSGVVAGIWTGVWIYLTAPLLGMIVAAELYLRNYGIERVYCAKLHHDGDQPCPFVCRFMALQSTTPPPDVSNKA
ncbi:MAG: aquaporin [Acidobacteriaceae bacterium]